jgi:hypothetical protein
MLEVSASGFTQPVICRLENGKELIETRGQRDPSWGA